MILAAVALVILAAFACYREHLFAKERDQWIQERSSLLNRIKPETAQVSGINDLEKYLVEPVRSDEDYWDARGMAPVVPDDVQFSPDGFPLQGESPFGGTP